jgi:hypothetical protein
MKQLEKGLFAIEDKMPCNPRDITVGKYGGLMATLDRMECEEAAARILTFSKQLDRWVGVSWTKLAEMMSKELNEERLRREARRHNMSEEWKFEAAMARRRKACFWTIGIYALCVAKPVKNLVEVPRFDEPISAIFHRGPGHVFEGVVELVHSGMLRMVVVEDEGKKHDVFFPTSGLIENIMRKQDVASA